MLEPGGHWPFVIAAYAATAIILIALVWASVAQSRRARALLDDLERRR